MIKEEADGKRSASPMPVMTLKVIFLLSTVFFCRLPQNKDQPNGNRSRQRDECIGDDQQYHRDTDSVLGIEAVSLGPGDQHKEGAEILGGEDKS